MEDHTSSNEPLNAEMNSKTAFVSKIVLIISIGGFLAYSLFEYFFGVRQVFITGLISCGAFLLPLFLVLIKRAKSGMAVFLVIMTAAMILTQYFYLRNDELLGLLMIDFSIYFGLVIISGFILNENRYIFFIVIAAGTANVIAAALLSHSIALPTKRFFIIELFVFLAVGFLMYYFSYLYNAFFKKARMEMEKQKKTTEKLSNLNRGFSRFVPGTFLELLQKEDITDVNLGDQIQMRMTVMFTDIRSFTGLSESMSPKETFDFLNSLLKFIGPTIRHFHGFIDKYIGDAVLSLYPENPEHAVMASLEIQRLLDMFNLQQKRTNKQPVKMGFGINTGDVIAGIIGEEERMEETVISDAVNIASRLESLTKLYGADIIVSEETIDAIENKEQIKYRFLDTLQAPGKIIPISIYEILDIYNLEKQRRYKLRKLYKAGWDCYCEGQIKKAILRFEKILSYDPKDKATVYQLNRCREFSE